MHNEISILSRRCHGGSCPAFFVPVRATSNPVFHELNRMELTRSGTGVPPVRLDLQSAKGRSRVRRDAVLRKPCFTIDFKRAGSSFDTILNDGRARTRTYLAISRSQSLTGLSCTNTTAGHDLNLTSSSEAGSGDNRSTVVFRHLKIQELTTTS